MRNSLLRMIGPPHAAAKLIEPVVNALIRSRPAWPVVALEGIQPWTIHFEEQASVVLVCSVLRTTST